MRTRSAALIALIFGMVLALSAPASAARPCIADLASERRGDMANVVGEWQNDFLELGQPAGWYAVHIAVNRAPNCP